MGALELPAIQSRLLAADGPSTQLREAHYRSVGRIDLFTPRPLSTLSTSEGQYGTRSYRFTPDFRSNVFGLSRMLRSLLTT